MTFCFKSFYILSNWVCFLSGMKVLLLYFKSDIFGTSFCQILPGYMKRKSYFTHTQYLLNIKKEKKEKNKGNEKARRRRRRRRSRRIRRSHHIFISCNLGRRSVWHLPDLKRENNIKLSKQLLKRKIESTSGLAIHIN